MRISDWSSDVCSSDLGMILLPMAEATSINLSVPIFAVLFAALLLGERTGWQRWSAVIVGFVGVLIVLDPGAGFAGGFGGHHGLGMLIALGRSEEHTSELQSLMRISYAVFCLKKKTE